MSCHASANLDLAIPNWVEPPKLRSGAAQAGTDVHKIVEDLMKVEYVTPSKTTKFSARDMLAAGRLLTYIGELWSTRRFSVLSEETFKATWLTLEPETTPDLVFYTKDEVHVIDSKWGTIPVEVVENEQLMFYAACVAPLAPKAKGVTAHILQPRADNMESWFIDTVRLGKFMDDARAAEAAIIAGDVTFNPNDHCTFCPANPHSRGVKGSPFCPAMMDLLGYGPQPIDEDEILGL